MEREKLIEEMAKALYESPGSGLMAHAGHAFPTPTWDNAYHAIRDDCRVNARSILFRLDSLGLCVVPKEPTDEMLVAGKAADWVGECESRAGCSILPSEYIDYSEDDPVKKTRPGIWCAMIAAVK